MFKITCAAEDCGKEFTTNFPHAKYCSDQCRWRESKRKAYHEREKAGVCVQCGKEMDVPKLTHKGRPNYCSKCQSYYHKRYKQRLGM